jgi:hypothetical protein
MVRILSHKASPQFRTLFLSLTRELKDREWYPDKEPIYRESDFHTRIRVCSIPYLREGKYCPDHRRAILILNMLTREWKPVKFFNWPKGKGKGKRHTGTRRRAWDRQKPPPTFS